MWNDGKMHARPTQGKDLLPFEVHLFDKGPEVGNLPEQRPEVDLGQCIDFDFLSSRDTGVAQVILDEGALAKASARAERRYVVVGTRGSGAARHVDASRTHQIEC